MLKMLNACTSELDDEKAAVKDILQGLNLTENLLKNSAAIITTYQDADENVVKAIAESLPFDSVGMTTFMSATENDCDYMQISVSVLTSDDVEFAVGCSEEIVAGSDREFSEALKNTLAKVKNPQAILGYAPLLPYASVDYFVKLVNQIDPKLMFFSSIVIDSTQGYRLASTIFNGERMKSRYPFIVLGGAEGAVKLNFAIATISPEKALHGRIDAVVSKSAPSQLIEINNAPVANYLKSLGLSQDKDGSFIGINAYPIIADFKDGTQSVIRAIFAFTPDGAAIIGGDIPVGSKISIGEIDVSEIVKTTANVLGEFVEKNKDANGFILYSCCGRYFNLGFNGIEEAETIRKIISAAGKPFLFAYVGGEICPVYKNVSETVNRGHNYSCIIAAL